MAAQAAGKKRRFLETGVILRYGLMFVAVCTLVTGVIYASQRFEQFLIRDPRFVLPGPPDYGLESPNLTVDGVKYASRDQILRVFDQDFGHSLYLFPMADRREQLLRVSWVREASVVRIWPNRVAVQITERQPAAFIKLPSEGMTRWALIDAEGVILDPPRKAAFHLPVLTGVRTSEARETRATRVRRMQRLMSDLGNLGNNVSEIDAGELDNLKVTGQVSGQAVSLMLGDRNFAQRLQSFVEHYPDIHRRMPEAAAFDLRLDDRITVLEGKDAR